MTVGSCEFESHLLHLKLKLKRGIFVACEWENLFSHNECSRKSQIYVVNAEIAQLVEHNLAPKKKGFQPWQGENKISVT